LQAIGLHLPQGAQTTISWWRKLRKLSLFALVSWQVWKKWNARCFRDATATIAELLQIIKMEADIWNAGSKPER
jgi:hypothetical protein